jgi:hypothetical protein
MRFKELKISSMVLVATVLLIMTIPQAYTTGTCDTEDFYPSSHEHDKWSYIDPSGRRIDTIITYSLWGEKSQYFQNGYYFSFDYYRTVSCGDGTDKDVYDYYWGLTNLPNPRVDVEEWNPWNPLCYALSRICNEEVEIGTKTPQDIQTNTWYYVSVYFTVKKQESYAVRIEPEVEPASTITPPPWEEWCLLACYNTKAGSSGW